MHKMQSGGWPYSEVGRDSEKLESTVSSSSCSSCSMHAEFISQRLVIKAYRPGRSSEFVTRPSSLE